MDGLVIVFFIFVAAFHAVLLAAILFATTAYFDEDKIKKEERYAMSAKLILLLGLIVIVGIGSCFALVAIN